MAIKLQKKTAAQPEVVEDKSTLSEFAALIDEVGDIQAKIEKAELAVAAKAKKELEALELLKKQLATKLPVLAGALNDAYDELDADKTFVDKGEKFQAEIGKKGNERKIKETCAMEVEGETITVTGIEALFRLMGEDVFMAKAKMNLKDIDDYLTPTQKEIVLLFNRVKRPVKIDKVVP